MGILDTLLRLFGGRSDYTFPKAERIFGDWAAYDGRSTLPFSRLPKFVNLPPEAETLGMQPGEAALSDVVFRYWLRVDRQVAGAFLPRIARGELYRTVTLPRDGKKPRQIDSPAPRLKWVQRRINERILSQIEVHPCAHGFVSGRSIFTNATPHTGKRVVVRMDLRDFFPSITFARVTGMFKAHGFDETTARLLAGLCCYRGRLPQGAPTSPLISNIICRRLDARLDGLVRSKNGTYTRYADDITVSGDATLLRLLPIINTIIGEEGFAPAPEKFAVQRSGSRQKVTGVIVNDTVSLSRKERRLIRAMVHNESTADRHDPELVRMLQGHIAFIQAAHPEEGRRLRAKLSAATA